MRLCGEDEVWFLNQKGYRRVSDLFYSNCEALNRDRVFV
jgi:hypothetical protein